MSLLKYNTYSLYIKHWRTIDLTENIVHMSVVCQCSWIQCFNQ